MPRRPGRSSARRGRAPPGPSRGRWPARRACAATGRGRTGWSPARPQPDRREAAARRGPRCPPAARPRFRGPNATSRSTDRSNSWSSGFWKTNPMVARELGRRSAGGVRAVDRDPPAAGRSRPLRCLTSVVLPEPFWPTIATRLARLDRERDAAHGLDAARVAMDQAVDLDARRRRPSPVPGGRPWTARHGRRPTAVERRGGASPRAPRAIGRPRRTRAPASTPARLGQPNERRRRAARRVRAAPCRARRPGRSSATARPASSTRQRSMRPRTVGSCSAHRIAVPRSSELVEQVGDRRGPGRIELGRRLVEHEDVGAHGHDAGDRHPLLLAARERERLAVGEVRDPQALERRRRSAASISARGTPRFSSPNASSSRTVSFDADSWLAGVENTIPTRPSRRAAVGGLRVDARRSSTAPPSVARTTRGMKPARPAPASTCRRPSGRPRRRARPAATVEDDAASGSARGGRGSGPRRSAIRSGARPAARPAASRRSSPDASSPSTRDGDDDDPDAGRAGPGRSQRSTGGSATTR